MKIIDFFFNNYKKIFTFLIIIIFLGIYLRTVNFGFINDDFDLVGKSWLNAIQTFLLGTHFRPLWYLSYPLINHFFGPSAFIHHLFNIVLHLVNLSIAYYLFKKLLNKEKALFIVFLWSFLPQISFQIAWISARNDLLMTFFLLLSLNLSIRDKYKTSLVFYILAFLSKVTCLFYPLIYFTRFGFGHTKSIKIISFFLFILLFFITYSALQNGFLESHLVEFSIPLRILNLIKNFVMGWFLLMFPLPFFKNILIGTIFLIFILTSLFIIIRSFKIEKTSILLGLISFTLSIPLSINYELRTTYALSLFVIATLISLIDLKILNLIKYIKVLKIIIFSSFLTYGTYTSFHMTNNFKSNQFDIYGKEYRVDNFYLNYFHLNFRMFQIRILDKFKN